MTVYAVSREHTPRLAIEHATFDSFKDVCDEVGRLFAAGQCVAIGFSQKIDWHSGCIINATPLTQNKICALNGILRQIEADVHSKANGRQHYYELYGVDSSFYLPEGKITGPTVFIVQG